MSNVSLRFHNTTGEEGAGEKSRGQIFDLDKGSLPCYFLVWRGRCGYSMQMLYIT